MTTGRINQVTIVTPNATTSEQAHRSMPNYLVITPGAHQLTLERDGKLDAWRHGLKHLECSCLNTTVVEQIISYTA